MLKSETTDPLFHSIARSQRAFEREIVFYRSLAPAVASRLPRIYGMGDANDPWLLMEDLSHYRAGDQVRGLSHEEARAVVRRLATIHACFWQKPDLEIHGWLPVHQYWFSDLDHTLLEPFLQTYGRRIGDRMSLVIEGCLKQLGEIDAAIANRPFTLVHGDLRADNLLFTGSESDPATIILDWQNACRSMGAIDLAYLLGGSEPFFERSGHLDELLYLWHGELVAQGVSHYSVADARKDLQLAALRCLPVALRLFATLDEPSTTVRGALFRDEAIERHCSVVDELRAWEALPLPIE